jgi:hypothetical protein
MRRGTNRIGFGLCHSLMGSQNRDLMPEMILSGIHDFNDLEAGFPTKAASGMTFCDVIFIHGDGYIPRSLLR